MGIWIYISYFMGRMFSLVLVDSRLGAGILNIITKCLQTNTHTVSAVTQVNKGHVPQRETPLGTKKIPVEQTIVTTMRNLLTKPRLFTTLDQVTLCQIIWKKKAKRTDSLGVSTSHDIFFHSTPKSTKGHHGSNLLNMANCSRKWNKTLYKLKKVWQSPPKYGAN